MPFLCIGVTSASFKELGNINDLNNSLILLHKQSTKVSTYSLVLVFPMFCFLKQKNLKVVPIQGIGGRSFMTPARKVINSDLPNNHAMFTTPMYYNGLTLSPYLQKMILAIRSTHLHISFFLR